MNLASCVGRIDASIPVKRLSEFQLLVPLHLTHTMAKAKEIAFARIINFGYLLTQNPTPLLQQQLSHAMVLHQQAIESPDINPFLRDLDVLHAQIEKHWARVYSDMLTTASLLWDINMFQRFLCSKLLEDYANEPYIVSGRILTLAESTVKQDQRHLAGATEDDNTISDEQYRDHVVFPLEESNLDRDYVEQKLRAVAARQGRPGNDIQPLIDACDWTKLAAALTSDRDIVTKLTQRSATFAEASEKILAGINRVQNKYFTSLSGPSTFTLASTGYQTSSSPRGSFARGIFDAIASGLKWDSPSSRVETPQTIADCYWEKMFQLRAYLC